ncbi:hypothetical protein [Clostridium sp.]|uniref:hypothetical protein n=1 Tax=Clostridium sp. TaxID=1506 RepID=UPI00321621F8
MHTFKGKSCTIHYNSDLSGEIYINKDGNEVKVDGRDLLNFVANHVRSTQISKLEQQTTDEILGI